MEDVTGRDGNRGLVPDLGAESSGSHATLRFLCIADVAPS